MELGRQIVHELKLDERGAVLERWLAHHLAELLAKSDEASGAERDSAEKDAVDLILKLWSHRRALPEGADPLSGYHQAISVLSRLTPESNPWARYNGRGSQCEAILQDMFATLSRAVLGGVVLTQSSLDTRVGEVGVNALEDEEVFLYEQIRLWMPNEPGVSSVVDEIKISEFSEDEDETEAEVETPVEEVDAGVYAHNIVLRNLEQFKEDLELLIERWRESAPEKPQSDGAR